ncbi:MAG: ArsB/NhaD family transporter [Chloroflexi bacterium]|nr:ArsB/NhaD family transporter [Chloroflexota bacterium]
MVLFLIALLSTLWFAIPTQIFSKESESGFLITGRTLDSQGQPVVAAEVSAHVPDEGEAIAEAESQGDGSWALLLDHVPKGVSVHIHRNHFVDQVIELDSAQLVRLQDTSTLWIEELSLEREITAGFWIATAIFVILLLLIAFEKLHSTTAALLGASAVFLVSAIGTAFAPSIYIFNFERALTYINWEVIFLVMAMMIVVAVIEETGIFQWTAFQAYRLSGGRSWVLVLILMAVTAVASALLDNFTTMLLMTPISLQIGLALGINPLALIIPEILASNVGGISTLIGTPTNILIGASAGIEFNGFLANQTIGVLIALVAMGAYVIWHYRKEWAKVSGGISETLYEKLKENGRIRDPNALKKSLVVFVLILFGFVAGEQIHVVPAVPAIIGATTLLIWLNPDIHHMIRAVDWTTLVFFMTLFMVVGAVQEVGLIALAAQGISQIVGENLGLAIFVIVVGVGTLSTVVANIPMAASMLPVVEFLTGTIPGADTKVLYYALSMGAAMGGNGLLIGGEANLVTAGITDQAGSPISFKEFLKIGLPVTYITLLIGYLWLLIRFGAY